MRPTGGQAIQQFCAYQRKRNLSPNTILVRRLRLRSLARFVDPKDLFDASTKDIERWLESLGSTKHGLSPVSRHNYISHVAAFYRWAIRQRHVRRDPTEELIRPKLPERVPRPWDPVLIAEAIALADNRMRCWLLLAWFAGARVMEMAALRVEDIHDEAILLHGKGNKERTVPLHPEVWKALRAFGLPTSGYVFRRRDGWPLKPATISEYISRYLHEQGIDATAHMGRHRFGTDLYELTGGDLLMVAKLMGHSSMQTTVGYAAWAQTRARGYVGQLAFPLPPIGDD